MKVNDWKRTDSLFVGQATRVARDHENYLWNNTWHDLHARPFKTNIKLLKQRTWIVFTRIQRVKIRYSCPFVMYTNFIRVLNYDTLKYKQIKGRELLYIAGNFNNFFVVMFHISSNPYYQNVGMSEHEICLRIFGQRDCLLLS